MGRNRVVIAGSFRLELEKTKTGTDRIVWHGKLNDEPQTFYVDPYTGFWKRVGVSLMGLLPIESQL